MKMSNTVKGFGNAIISAATFGLIPLFTKPVMDSGMVTSSILVYRFGFGALVMLALMFFNHIKPSVNKDELWRIVFLAAIYTVSAMALIESYNYMDTGIATTLMFSYPIFTSLIMTIFFGEKFSPVTAIAIILAVVGVFFLSGAAENGNVKSAVGLLFAIISGFAYSCYMVSVNVMKVRQMGSLKLTFWVLLVGTFMLAAYSMTTKGSIQTISQPLQFFSLLGLAIIPTAVSNLTLIMGIKQVGSTMCAVLGAFEPLTALTVGILVFGEPMTIYVAIGFLLIIISVTMIVLKNKKKKG